MIGILGGMGPEATVELMRRVIERTPARDDQDHVHLLVDNNPQVPSRIAALLEESGPSPLDELVRMARRLEHAGAHCLAMPCNTAHYYLHTLGQQVTVPFLDMIQLTTERVVQLQPKRVGLLASTAVLKLGLYAQALASAQVSLLVPESQDSVMELIRAVKRGEVGGETPGRFLNTVQALEQSGCDVLLVACTELSLLAPHLKTSMHVIDALDCLTDAIVQAGQGRLSEGSR
jgi:aspartate racemase